MSKVIRGGVPKAPRIVVYGSPKVGKSTFACGAEDPIVVATEEGVAGLPVDQYPQAKDWNELLENLNEAASSRNYKTLVLDTINGAESLAAAWVCKEMFADDWGPTGYGSFGKGAAATANEMRRLIVAMDVARETGKTVVCTAHLGTRSVSNPVEGDYVKWTPDLSKGVWALFFAWSDIIGRADFDYNVLAATELGRKGRAIGTSTRVLHLVGSAAEDAGCRAGFALPAKLPLEWEAFREALGKIDSLVAEVKAGWPVFTEDEAARALKYLGGSIERSTAPKLSVVLDRIRNKSKKETPNG